MAIEDIVKLVMLGTSIWVFFDAKKIGIKRGQVKGLAGMGPWGWFLSCILLWIIAFPFYLAKRSYLKQISSNSSNLGKTPEHNQPSLKDS